MHPLFKDVDYGWGELEPLINSSQFDFTESVSEDSQIKMYEQDVWE